MQHSALSLFSHGLLRSSSAIITPPVPGYSIWVAPESSVFSDVAGTTPAVSDGEVKRWNDLSGNGNHLVHVVADSSSGPRYNASNTLNSRRILRFGAGFGATPAYTRLQIDSFALSTAGHTFFCVGRNVNPPLATDNYTDFVSWAGPSGLRTKIDIGALAGYNDASASYPLASVGSFVMGSWGALARRFDNVANTQEVFNGGSSVANIADSWAGSTPGSLRIGGRSGSNASALSGDIAEVIVYGSALSNPDIVLVSNYLKTKYGL